MKSDLSIAHSAKLRPIDNIAAKLGISKMHFEALGEAMAKVSIDILKAKRPRKQSKYILVTGVTPTPFGEGKTVTTIGLSMALNSLKKRAVACIRQPSIGPFFGIKGGGLGGGYSQVVPTEEISLNFTGDIHAVSQAHNLAAAFLDNHLYRGNRLKIDLGRIFWPRVIDVNDRALRHIRIAVGGGAAGVERIDRFDITAASEIMAILALTESIPDMRRRLGSIVVALARDGSPVTCDDLKVAGSMAALLKDAINPNLVQTIEGTPCLIHTGPFANIMHGNSSIVADKIGLAHADYVVTESGFGADCGAEKFFDIKCRQSGLRPDAAVLVTSIRALKSHSGLFRVASGKKIDSAIYRENTEAVEMGCSNLKKQIENVRIFGIPCVVAINRFGSDTPRELHLVKMIASHSGAFDCVVSEVFAKGSTGGIDLANAVARAAGTKSEFKPLYQLGMPIRDKIEIIARRIYGAKGVHYSPGADESIAGFQKLGFGKLPVCMAKTHLSISHDPNLKGWPKGFTLPVREIRPSIGAGFLYAVCGATHTMPSLPSHPIGERIDIDSKGRLRYVP